MQKLPVICQEMTADKYSEKVKVYTIGDFSKEICGGLHADNTSKLRHFRIVKEESVAAGVRRIKAILEDGKVSMMIL